MDAIVFTAGIGENSSLLRKLVTQEVHLLRLTLDQAANEVAYEDWALISNADSAIPLYKMRTNEELMICQDVQTLLKL